MKMSHIKFTVFDNHGDIVFRDVHISELAAYVDANYRADLNKRKPTTVLRERGYLIKVKVMR